MEHAARLAIDRDDGLVRCVLFPSPHRTLICEVHPQIHAIRLPWAADIPNIQLYRISIIFDEIPHDDKPSGLIMRVLGQNARGQLHTCQHPKQ